MATRTSHSSPCFLRVAEASAASSASKMISLSTPFSLETASTTIRISLFIVRPPDSRECSKLRRQVRLAYVRDRYGMALPVHRDLDRRRRHCCQRPCEPPPAVDRRDELDVNLLTDEA